MAIPPSGREPPDSANYATQVVSVDPRAHRSRAVLTLTSGVDAGRVLSLVTGQLVTLGRAPECTYPFDDPSLSREHVRLVRVGEDWILKDSGSTNGSFVNEVRTTAAVTLRDGDRIQLGSGTTLRFALVDEAEERALRQVYEAASRDALTGAWNRKHLDERLVAEIDFAKRHRSLLSVVIVDIDFFKRVNDTHGHLAGDAVLKAVAERLGSLLRTEDVLARYGGEEFVILARGIGKDAAVALADRVREQLAATPVMWGEVAIPVTASMGVASLACCGTDPSKERLLGTADGRLYRAKESGRNRVVG